MTLRPHPFAGFLSVLIAAALEARLPSQVPEMPPDAATAAETALATTQPADDELLVILGPVLTLDPARPRAEALIVRRGLIELAGDAASVLAEAGPGAPILHVPPGGVVMPGIIESHAHLLGVGRARRLLDLRGTQSPAEVAARVRAHAQSVPGGHWILGRGWNQELWPEKTFPDRALLDEAAPDHAVVLVRVDGHALWANSLALARAAITPKTAAPAGGEILKDKDGVPTGILVDNAMDLLRRILPAENDPEEIAQDYLAAQEAAFSEGITTFVDAGASVAQLHVLGRLYQEGRMKLRTATMLSVSDESMLDEVMERSPLIGLYGDRATVRAIKIYADGALGSRGAWLLEPYSDRPDHRGLSTTPPSLIESAARRALRKGWQVCVHAIGDRAVRETLDAFERALEAVQDGAPADHRFRIEHAQILDGSEVPRFRALGVIPSMQTCHAISDGPWVEARIGADRTEEGAYAWRALLDAGSIIPNGTDAPVEDLSPWTNLFAAVTRWIPDAGGGSGYVFLPRQRMNRLEGLRSLTVWGAYGIFAEDRRGRIRPGLQADLVVLDRDPLTCSAWDLQGTRVVNTIVAGEVVHGPMPLQATGSAR